MISIHIQKYQQLMVNASEYCQQFNVSCRHQILSYRKVSSEFWKGRFCPDSHGIRGTSVFTAVSWYKIQSGRLLCDKSGLSEVAEGNLSSGKSRSRLAWGCLKLDTNPNCLGRNEGSICQDVRLPQGCMILLAISSPIIWARRKLAVCCVTRSKSSYRFHRISWSHLNA